VRREQGVWDQRYGERQRLDVPPEPQTECLDVLIWDECE